MNRERAKQALEAMVSKAHASGVGRHVEGFDYGIRLCVHVKEGRPDVWTIHGLPTTYADAVSMITEASPYC